MRILFLALAAISTAQVQAASTLRLRVVDIQGLAVPGARVEVRALRGGPVAGLTGPDGRAEFLLDGATEVRVRAEGFEPLSRPLEGPEAQPLVLQLQPAVLRTTVNVTVRDEALPLGAVGSAMEIDRTAARTVFDGLDRVVPGAFVTRRGVMGYGVATNGTGGLSIRGVGESPNAGILVVVDGRPDFQGLMGHPLPDFYSLSDTSTVTIVEGPASVLYGSNAMGGIVEIKPWVPTQGMSTRLTTSFGSFYTGQHRLSHGTAFRRGYYSFNADVSHTSGDRPGSAFRDQNATFAVGYDLSEAWRASFDARYGHFYVEDPGPVSAPLAGSYADLGRGGFSVDLDNTTARAWGYLRAYSSYGRNRITDGFRSTDRTTGMRLDENIAWTRALTLEMGSDIVNYGGAARNIQQRLDYGAHDLTSVAGFARLQWAAAGNLRLFAGGRYESNSLFGGTGVPEVGAVWTPRGRITLSAEAAEGYRNPTLRELYLFPAPNPSLKPEHMRNYQASVQVRPAGSLTATVTGFYADLSNLIVTAGRYPNLALSNTGAALNRGIELTGRWRASRRVALQSGYAYLRSTNLAPYVPANKFNYGADIDAGKLFINFGGMIVGERWSDTRHSGKLAGYHLGELKVTVPVGERWRVFTLVDNLFDRRYSVVPGYPMPGINAMGGLSASF
ncbi:MAG: TonB-dependent receptor [Acidobacteria bacterium]|nr:TonB-dependent receptor [Acidobacteriota bacterium]